MFEVRVRFNDSYFTILVEVFTNHILAENTYLTNRIEWPERKIMVLKPASKYQIIRHCHNFKNILINDFHHHPFLYQAKVLQTFFYGAKITNWKNDSIHHSGIYLLFDLLWYQKSIL